MRKKDQTRNVFFAVGDEMERRVLDIGFPIKTNEIRDLVLNTPYVSMPPDVVNVLYVLAA